MYLFQSTRNTRPVLENSLRYIRSDVPAVISEEETNWLLVNHITTIVDLRTAEERARKRCPLVDDLRFDYKLFPLTGGDTVPQTTDDVSKSYISMVDECFESLIDFLLAVKSNVLYFCNAGKDRTGVVSAVLLHRLGVPHKQIIRDYMMSKENLETMLNEFAEKNPGINIDVITPQERYMEEFLQWYAGNG